MSHLSNSMPDVALDPGERVLLADGQDHVVGGKEHGVDAPSRSAGPCRRRSTRGARTPCRSACRSRRRSAWATWLMRISTCSSSASSSSQGDALKNWRGRRAMTLTSLPPRRRDVRQQSMAVLPTPMIRTRSPILSMCPNATHSSQSMPMWMLVGGLLAARQVQLLAARRAGADEHGVEAGFRRAAPSGSRPGVL